VDLLAGQPVRLELVIVVERRNPEEAGLGPVEDAREDRPRLEAVEHAQSIEPSFETSAPEWQSESSA
jgi:hypothetical protein